MHRTTVSSPTYNGFEYTTNSVHILRSSIAAMTSSMRVLISGGGVAGPTLAWWLSKAGATVTILEKAPRLLPHGQNIDIHGTAISVVKQMGLMDEIRRYNTTEKGTQFIGPDGRPFGLMRMKPGSSASPTSEYEILRGDLAAVFHRAAKDLPGVDFRFGTTIRRVISNDNACVKIELDDGQVGEYDLLVAADGQWSRLRKEWFPAESVEVVDYNLFTAYWTMTRSPEDNDFWNIYQGTDARVVSLRPDPHGTIRASVTHMPPTPEKRRDWEQAYESRDKVKQAELLKRDFSDAGWIAERLLGGIDDAPDFYFHPIQQIRMSEWAKERIVCLGDSAWAPTPLTGSGTTLAILGAYVLAGELAKLPPGEHPARAFKAYDEAFRPFVTQTQNFPVWVPRVVHPRSSWRRWVTQVGLGTMIRVVTQPWIIRWIDQPADAEDYKLPEYTKLKEATAAA